MCKYKHVSDVKVKYVKKQQRNTLSACSTKCSGKVYKNYTINFRKLMNHISYINYESYFI